MCTTQVCNVASGQVARIDSGRPLRPSQHTISASARHRFLNSPSIDAHCLAFSHTVGPSHKPQKQQLHLRPNRRRWRRTRAGSRPATSRTLNENAPINSTGYTASRGRFCHAAMSATISSVIFENVKRAHRGVVDLGQIPLGSHHGGEPLGVQRNHVALPGRRGAAGAWGP